MRALGIVFALDFDLQMVWCRFRSSNVNGLVVRAVLEEQEHQDSIDGAPEGQVEQIVADIKHKNFDKLRPSLLEDGFPKRNKNLVEVKNDSWKND